MKNPVILFLFLLLCVGCTDSDSDTPSLKIVSVLIVGDEEATNYARKLDRIPVLAVGTELEIVFNLDGNSNGLGSFVAVNENPGLQVTLDVESEKISNDLSNLNEGKLVFVDGVNKLPLTATIRVNAISEEEQLLSFHLFSKAVDSKGAREDVKLKTGIVEEE